MFRAIVCLTLFFISLHIFAQDVKVEFDGKKWIAPYSLPMPAGWDVERFPIPISFAPQIQYSGMEDIRFTPGWGKTNTDEYWTYAFLWYLHERPKTNAKIIEQNLKHYYTGLIAINTQGSKIPVEKFVTTKTSVKKIKRDARDQETYTGTIFMFDYMTQLPITLNCIIHVKVCPGTKKTFIFHEISPKPLGHKAWKSLDQLWTDFDCSKKG